MLAEPQKVKWKKWIGNWLQFPYGFAQASLQEYAGSL
jgi:hypothetical protein